MGIDILLYPNEAVGLNLCRRLDTVIYFWVPRVSGPLVGQITLRYLECLLVFNAESAAK